jgi:hypothetical protein
MILPTRRAAFYVRVSTSDRGQSVENQLRPLQEAARRLGWTIVAVHLSICRRVCPVRSAIDPSMDGNRNEQESCQN